VLHAFCSFSLENIFAVMSEVVNLRFSWPDAQDDFHYTSVHNSAFEFESVLLFFNNAPERRNADLLLSIFESRVSVDASSPRRSCGPERREALFRRPDCLVADQGRPVVLAR
jgi:hypothetical protein